MLYEFSNWLLKFGNGTLSNENDFHEDISEVIEQMVYKDSFVTKIFGDNLQASDAHNLQKRTSYA